MKYHIKEYSRGYWHVVDERGHPVYDGELHGNDKPLVFRDEDAAWNCMEALNNELEKENEE